MVKVLLRNGRIPGSSGSSGVQLARLNQQHGRGPVDRCLPEFSGSVHIDRCPLCPLPPCLEPQDNYLALSTQFPSIGSLGCISGKT